MSTWQDVGKFMQSNMGGLAATAGGLLSGNVGGVVAGVSSIIQNVTGGSTPDQVLSTLTAASPADLAAYQERLLEHREKLIELDNQRLQLELADTQNARALHKDSRMPAIICVVLTVLVALVGFALMKYSIPDDNKELVYLIYGALIANWGASISYHVGTTRGSAMKNNWKLRT